MTTLTRAVVLCDVRRPGCYREHAREGTLADARKTAKTIGWFRSVSPPMDSCPPCSGEVSPFTRQTPLFITAAHLPAARVVARALNLQPHQWVYLSDLTYQLRGRRDVKLAAGPGAEGHRDHPLLQQLLGSIGAEWVEWQ